MFSSVRPLLSAAAGLCALLLTTIAFADDVFDAILDRGHINCGVHQSFPGFAEPRGSGGKYVGFEADYCKALSVAVFGKKKHVNFVPLAAAERFSALREGHVDVVIRTTTHTLSRDAGIGGEAVNFGPVIFHDGQGFMSDLFAGPIATVPDLIDFLDGRSVCAAAASTHLANLLALGANNLLIEGHDPIGDYEAGLCDVLTSDRSALAGAKALLSSRVASSIFEVMISRELLAPVVAEDDDAWFDIVRWVVYATRFAEERGISRQNVASFVPRNAEEEMFLGISGDLGNKLGLHNSWAKRVIKKVGNYADIYERHLQTLLPRDRANLLYRDGGPYHSPLFR